MYEVGETCNKCKKHIPWEQGYVNQFVGMNELNQIEQCDNCKKYFCKDCFIACYGKESFNEMMNNSRYKNGKVLCPDCYDKV